jgi:hypothetical protein
MRHKGGLCRAAAIAALTLSAAAAAPAGAEPVTDLGQGQDPSVVTDAAGTLHAVWRDPSVNTRPVLYCRMAATGGGCTAIPIAQDIVGRPRLLLRPQDGALIAVFGSHDPNNDPVTKVVTSADGGTTWSAPAIVGTGLDEVEDAELTPDGAAIDTVSGTPQYVAEFQRVPVSGGPEGRIVPLGELTTRLWPRLTHLGDGRPVVIGHYAESRLGARVAAAGADPNDPAAWGPASAWPGLRGGYSSDGDVGPTGTWLLSSVRDKVGAGPSPVRIWRWTDQGFQHPRTIGALARGANPTVGEVEEPSGASRTALDVDLGGRLHAAWPLQARSCGGVSCIVYRRTDRSGFGPAVVYPVGNTGDDTVEGFGLAANAGGSGWLVWASHSHRVRAVGLVTPPVGSRVGSRRIGGHRRVTVPDFYGCVPSGGTFVHRLRVDGRRGARILSVRFFFDAGQPARTDRRAPYRIAFKLTFPAGSRHVASAIVRYRLPGSRRVHSVRIGRTFVMC